MNNIHHTAILEAHPDVMMDDCHIDLIRSLVLSSKPATILEIGIGTGAVTATLLKAIKTNGIGSLTCVDNFVDWNFNTPKGFEQLEGAVEFIQSTEEAFIDTCDRKFDFIISDADHNNTGRWFNSTLSLLNDGGILIYHDATSPHYPSVSHCLRLAGEQNLDHMVFNKSSQPWERCERGLLVIMKGRSA